MTEGTLHEKVDQLTQAVASLTRRMDGLDLNGSAATLREWGKTGGLLDQWKPVLSQVLNLVANQTEDQLALQDFSMTHAPQLVRVLPALLKETEAREHKQRIRAEVWGYLAAPFRRYRRLGIILGPVFLALLGAVIDRIVWHLF